MPDRRVRIRSANVLIVLAWIIRWVDLQELYLKCPPGNIIGKHKYSVCNIQAVPSALGKKFRIIIVKSFPCWVPVIDISDVETVLFPLKQPVFLQNFHPFRCPWKRTLIWIVCPAFSPILCCNDNVGRSPFLR